MLLEVSNNIAYSTIRRILQLLRFGTSTIKLGSKLDLNNKVLQQQLTDKTLLPEKTVRESGAHKDELNKLNWYSAQYYAQPCLNRGYNVYITLDWYGDKKYFNETSAILNDAICQAAYKAISFVYQNKRETELNEIAKILNLPK